MAESSSTTKMTPEKRFLDDFRESAIALELDTKHRSSNNSNAKYDSQREPTEQSKDQGTSTFVEAEPRFQSTKQILDTYSQNFADIRANDISKEVARMLGREGDIATAATEAANDRFPEMLPDSEVTYRRPPKVHRRMSRSMDMSNCIYEEYAEEQNTRTNISKQLSDPSTVSAKYNGETSFKTPDIANFSKETVTNMFRASPMLARGTTVDMSGPTTLTISETGRYPDTIILNNTRNYDPLRLSTDEEVSTRARKVSCPDYSPRQNTGRRAFISEKDHFDTGSTPTMDSVKFRYNIESFNSDHSVHRRPVVDSAYFSESSSPGRDRSRESDKGYFATQMESYLTARENPTGNHKRIAEKPYQRELDVPLAEIRRHSMSGDTSPNTSRRGSRDLAGGRVKSSSLGRSQLLPEDFADHLTDYFSEKSYKIQTKSEEIQCSGNKAPDTSADMRSGVLPLLPYGNNEPKPHENFNTRSIDNSDAGLANETDSADGLKFLVQSMMMKKDAQKYGSNIRGTGTSDNSVISNSDMIDPRKNFETRKSLQEIKKQERLKHLAALTKRNTSLPAAEVVSNLFHNRRPNAESVTAMNNSETYNRDAIVEQNLETVHEQKNKATYNSMSASKLPKENSRDTPFTATKSVLPEWATLNYSNEGNSIQQKPMLLAYRRSIPLSPQTEASSTSNSSRRSSAGSIKTIIDNTELSSVGNIVEHGNRHNIQGSQSATTKSNLLGDFDENTSVAPQTRNAEKLIQKPVITTEQPHNENKSGIEQNVKIIPKETIGGKTGSLTNTTNNGYVNVATSSAKPTKPIKKLRGSDLVLPGATYQDEMDDFHSYVNITETDIFKNNASGNITPNNNNGDAKNKTNNDYYNFDAIINNDIRPKVEPRSKGRYEPKITRTGAHGYVNLQQSKGILARIRAAQKSNGTVSLSSSSSALEKSSDTAVGEKSPKNRLKNFAKNITNLSGKYVRSSASVGSLQSNGDEISPMAQSPGLLKEHSFYYGNWSGSSSSISQTESTSSLSTSQTELTQLPRLGNRRRSESCGDLESVLDLQTDRDSKFEKLGISVGSQYGSEETLNYINIIPRSNQHNRLSVPGSPVHSRQSSQVSQLQMSEAPSPVSGTPPQRRTQKQTNYRRLAQKKPSDAGLHYSRIDPSRTKALQEAMRKRSSELQVPGADKTSEFISDQKSSRVNSKKKPTRQLSRQQTKEKKRPSGSKREANKKQNGNATDPGGAIEFNRESVSDLKQIMAADLDTAKNPVTNLLRNTESTQRLEENGVKDDISSSNEPNLGSFGIASTEQNPTPDGNDPLEVLFIRPEERSPEQQLKAEELKTFHDTERAEFRQSIPDSGSQAGTVGRGSVSTGSNAKRNSSLSRNPKKLMRRVLSRERND